MKSRKFEIALAAAAVLTGLSLRMFHFARLNESLHADEFIVGLMAKHILEGREFPVFFYGQHYLGAFESYLAAMGFAVWGASPMALRLIPLVFSVALIGVVFLFARSLYGLKTAALAVLLVSLPSRFFLDFSLAARGGFAEALVLMAVATWVGFLLLRKDGSGFKEHLAYGLLCGFLFFIYQSVIVYFLAAFGIFLLSKSFPSGRAMAVWGLGFLAGSAPLLVYNVVYPFATFIQLGGKFLDVSSQMYRDDGVSGLLAGFVGRNASVLRTGLDSFFRVYTGHPLREADWGSAAQGAAFGGVILFFIFAKRHRLGSLLKGKLKWADADATDFILFLLILTFAAGFRRPRYLLFAYPLGALLLVRGAMLLRPGWLAPVLLSALALMNGFDTAAFIRSQPRAPYALLLNKLEASGCTRGYAGYYTAYPINFLSNERIVLSPRAGPVAMDRYPSYTRLVERAKKLCFVFPAGDPSDLVFRDKLRGLGLPFRAERAGAWILYSGFKPEDLESIRLPVRR